MLRLRRRLYRRGAVGEGAQVEGPQAVLEAAGLVVAQQLRASANTALQSKVVGYTVPETPGNPRKPPKPQVIGYCPRNPETRRDHRDLVGIGSGGRLTMASLTRSHDVPVAP